MLFIDKNNKWAWTGILAVFIFLILLFTAYLMFPGQYTPLENWMSDLGNMELNPQGAVFFNFGCIIAGFILIPFFVSLSWLKREDDNKLLITTQILGFIAAIFLIMVGIFPENYPPWHWMWSALFFITLLIFLVLVTIFMWSHPLFPRSLVYYGFFVIIVDLYFITINIIPIWLPKPLLEWFSVISALGLLLGMSFVMLTSRNKRDSKISN
ncbi:DUF998 domain-containing protein [Methanobacterium petrolearium]|uniref:DUF998 domain-containing protein n=1 Tax=Methanobacterium petrolearium TaxID=710190 RepID=UPI001AE6E8DF|nr:DUF998 domain-containing protein [Methanobacterium petrolearium]MBP1945033.1 putative membrane protein [Methanobacterium petrolearium]